MFERVLPVDDVDSGAIDLAGRLAELVDRLGVALDALSRPLTVPGWADALAAAADALTAVPERDAWQRYELRRLLDELVAEASGASIELTLPEIRALIGDRLEGRPTRANFRTGHLTICTLVPMRSVPHRVVCLLGLDDGVFPRRGRAGGDDLLLEQPLVGDRDPRSEDRQLLLDALLAAGEALIVTYSGNDERTNAPLPPAVPIGELLDAVDATASCAERPELPARRHVLVRHPLQPFDPRNFAPGRFVEGRPWSFDPVALEGAKALGSERLQPAAFLSGPLPPAPDATLTLAELVAFVERPVRAFLRQRLGVSTGSFDDEIDDALPVALDALEQWGVGQRLLEGVLAGVEPRECMLAEQARGTLPPGALGLPVLRGVWPTVDAIVRHARVHAGAGAGEPRSLETNLILPGGTRLTGTVSGVRGDVLLAVSYSRLSARHRLGAWVRLLALSAAHPEIPFEAVTIARARSRSDEPSVSVARIPALGRDAVSRGEKAVALLAGLARLRARGMREPLPIPCLTAAAYAAARSPLDPGAGRDAAARAWTSEWSFDREDREPEHLLAFGGELTIDELLAIAPRAEESGRGWDEQEESRFGRYAVALWGPLLARESVVEA
jgi:exodeoxyribonuclease V gamma subunit